MINISKQANLDNEENIGKQLRKQLKNINLSLTSCYNINISIDKDVMCPSWNPTDGHNSNLGIQRNSQDQSQLLVTSVNEDVGDGFDLDKNISIDSKYSN